MSTPGTPQPVRRWLLLVVVAYLLFGLFPHDPWKTPEAISFGVAHEILRTGQWLVPRLAGEPFLEHMPLLPQVGAALALALAPVLAPHDAARLAAGLFVALALAATSLTARRLYGPGSGWQASMALLGCVGLMVRAHEFTPQLAGMAGIAMGMLGLALGARRPLVGGALLGTGGGSGFLAGGLVAPVSLALAAALLPAFRDWRRREYALAAIVGAFAAAPWLLAWPLALRAHDPKLFSLWLSHALLHDGNLPRGDALAGVLYYLRTIPWYAWPAAPLVFWTFWRGRLKALRDPGVVLPLLVALATLAALAATEKAADLQAVHLLPPLAVLAVRHLADLPRGAASGLDWFGIMTFGLVAIILWLAWVALVTGYPPALAAPLEAYLPGREVRPGAAAVATAAVFTALWLALVRHVGRSFQRALINWAGGITLTWVLLSTLWIGWLDAVKSYRGMMAEMRAAMPVSYGCIASSGLGAAQRASLSYFEGIVTRRHEAAGRRGCDLLLVQTRAGDPPRLERRGWTLLWQGSRPGDRNEQFYLYRKRRG